MLLIKTAGMQNLLFTAYININLPNAASLNVAFCALQALLLHLLFRHRRQHAELGLVILVRQNLHVPISALTIHFGGRMTTRLAYLWHDS